MVDGLTSLQLQVVLCTNHFESTAPYCILHSPFVLLTVSTISFSLVPCNGAFLNSVCDFDAAIRNDHSDMEEFCKQLHHASFGEDFHCVPLLVDTDDAKR